MYSDEWCAKVSMPKIFSEIDENVLHKKPITVNLLSPILYKTHDVPEPLNALRLPNIVERSWTSYFK